MKITCAAFVLLIHTLQCLTSDDSPFQLTNNKTGFCLVKTNNNCNDIRWTTGDRLLVLQRNKCLGVQGKSVGSEISLYDCDENSELQKWECMNETVLALKDQELYIKLTADSTAVLSYTVGPNDHLTISGTSSGACTRTYREFYTIGGNAAGMPCMFPFKYKNQWYSDCTTLDSPGKRLMCAVETKYQTERWGYCPVTSKEGWNIHPVTGAYYQLNTQSALTWPQAETSCKQQGASLLSITDPFQQAYVIALLGTIGSKLWTGLVLDREHSWKWSNGRPYRYMNWDSEHPLPYPGHNCVFSDPAVQYTWQSSSCSKKLGYICYSEAAEDLLTQAVQTGFCQTPWIPYNGHCFHLNRTQKTWSDAQRECRDRGGDLASIQNVEDQSFVISQLGYASTDELWIGLNDRKTEGLFDWIDHSTVSFTSWEFGKPDVSSEIKDCVLIRGENGNWADSVCEEKHGSICVKQSSLKPTGDEREQDVGCRSAWRRHGSYCYFIETQTKTFDEARDDCKSSNSYLADVSNGVDNAFLVSLVGMRPEKHFWLGLSNQILIAEFVWTNKNSVTFTHWNAQMPGHRRGCVAMATGIFAGLWDVLPCTNREKYICKHLAEGARLTPVPPTVITTICAQGWTHIKSRDYCYKVFPERLGHQRTWYEARDFCRAIGGDLLSIHSAADQQLLTKHYNNVWIGLSAPDPGTGYVWSDGSPLQFQHWEDGQPNSKTTVESCTEFRMYRTQMSSGSWNDRYCEISNDWLCEIHIGVVPKPTPGPVTPDYNRTSDSWLEWNGNQYYINSVLMAMEDARRTCKQKHGDLVTINSEAENVFLWKRIFRGYSFYWIGLTVDLDKTYGWMDGSPVVFQKWQQNEPRFLNNDENAVAMSTNMGFWHNYNSGFEYSSICKRSASPHPTATVAPTDLPKGGCPQNWIRFDTKCYNIINNQTETWFGARTQCKAMGGNLASILSRFEQVLLTTKMVDAPTTDLWIGLTSGVGQSRVYWTDGRPMRYSKFWYERSFNHYHVYNPQGQCGVLTTDPNIGIGKWVMKSCNDTAGYICLRNVDPSLQDSPEPTMNTNYVKIFNDSIKVVTQPMTWNAAEKNCESDGAKLASLRNEWSHIYTELMVLKLKAPLWIGLNKLKTGGYFRFIDGQPLKIPKWGPQEPGRQPCVFMDIDGKWKTADCNEKKRSICMQSTDMPPTESSDFPGFCPDDPSSFRLGISYSWIPFKGYCYLFCTDNTLWSVASVKCLAHGATLASIENPSEQVFIQSVIKAYENNFDRFWIGLYKTNTGMLRWLDKTAIDYNNFGENSYNSENYGSIECADGTWYLTSLWSHKPYICKAPKVILQASPTVVNPTVGPQSHGHIILAVVLVIAAIAIGTVLIICVVRKFGHHLHLPVKFTTFNNPLFFNNEETQPNMVDTNGMTANAEEENSGLFVNA